MSCWSPRLRHPPSESRRCSTAAGAAAQTDSRECHCVRPQRERANDARDSIRAARGTAQPQRRGEANNAEIAEAGVLFAANLFAPPAAPVAQGSPRQRTTAPEAL